jgi:hypothetical protein
VSATHPALLEDEQHLEDVTAAARLALENERLQADAAGASRAVARVANADCRGG